MKRIFVVLNPVAGSGQASKAKQQLAERLEGKNLTYELYETTGEENLPLIVQNAVDEGYDTFIAAGGDGTVSQVADALAETPIPIGIIPLGTSNALARNLNLPLNIEQSLDLILGMHQLKAIDVMQVNDRYFFLQIGVGLTAKAVKTAARESKNWLGRFAYIWGGLNTMARIQKQSFTLIVDGITHQVQATQVTVANSNILVSEPLYWGPHIKVDDGQLDLCIIKAQGLASYMGLIANALLKRHRQSPALQYLVAKNSISIQTKQPLSVQADGDLLGKTPLHINLVPAALQVIVPP